MGAYNRALNRPALSIHLLAVVVLAAASSFLPSAFTGHASAAEAAVPVSRLPVATSDSASTGALGASLGSVVSFSSLIAEGLARPVVHPSSKSKKTTSAKPSVQEHKTQSPAAVPRRSPVSTRPASSEQAGYGCSYAIAYLRAHAAPGFSFECPGYADGHQAMTCINIAGLCPGSKLIAISTPCSAAYMNEASNSWVLLGLKDAPIDPYGYCHS